MEVIGALLAKGASPNINAMGVTPFLLAAGVGGGGRGGAGGAANTLLMDQMIAHGADVNAQVTGTKTYSMRVARAPANNEGTSALHTAVQAGRVETVRYLLDKGANPDLVDSNGRKAIDLLGNASLNAGGRAGGAQGGAPAPRGGPGGGAALSPATVAEIRALLETAGSKK